MIGYDSLPQELPGLPASNLRLLPPPKKVPDAFDSAQVVVSDLVRDMMAIMERERIVGFAAVMTNDKGQIYEAWAKRSVPIVLGGLTCLQQRIARWMDE